LAFLSLLLVAAGDASSLGLPPWALELIGQGLLGAWLFALGASVGSFLNVVVYRLPQGMDLAHPGSHCPSCGHAIRARDNLPLLGWLLLGGRCRDCRSPISPRYYYVELCCAIVFVLVAIFEGLIATDALRLGAGLSYPAISPFQPFPFWTAYAAHVVLLVTLLAAALIQGDGFAVPGKLFLPAMLLGLAGPLVWPEIRPLLAWPGLALSGVSLANWQAGIVDGAAGLAAGLAIGAVVGSLGKLVSPARRWPDFAPVATWCAVGSVLGWQPTLVLAPFVLLLVASARTIGWLTGAKRQIPLAAVALPLVAWVLTGQATPLRTLLDSLADYPVAGSAVLIGILALASGWAAALSSRQDQPRPPAAAKHPIDPPPQATRSVNEPELSSLDPPAS
jgi:leader peptidase (prepilin peptidase) / N-methyltransferase